jgi:hypothetical protein
MLAMSAIALGVALDADDELEHAKEKEKEEAAVETSYGPSYNYDQASFIQCSSDALGLRAMEATAVTFAVDDLSDHRSQLARLPRVCAAGTLLCACSFCATLF